MDLTIIALLLILLFASFTQGLSGFGFQLVAIPLMSMFINIKEAIPLAALCGLLVNIYLIIILRQNIKLFDLKKLIFGAVVGIPIGVFFLSNASAQLIEYLLGLILISFFIINYFNIIHVINLSDKWGYMFGLISGILGGAFNTNGPPVIIYFYLKGLDKHKLKASITGYFIFTSVFIVSSHLITGLATLKTYTMFLEFSPIVLAGIMLGNLLFKKLTDKSYNTLVLIILLVLGISMFVR